MVQDGGLANDVALIARRREGDVLEPVVDLVLLFQGTSGRVCEFQLTRYSVLLLRV